MHPTAPDTSLTPAAALATTPPRNILVLGGTGFVGRSVCERLVQRSGGTGGRIAVPTRRAQHGNGIRFLPTLDVVPADVHSDSQLARLVAGCDAVINLVAVLHGSAKTFDAVHVQLPRRLAAACHGAGVRRVIHVSALGVGDGVGDGVHDGAPPAPSNYLRSKAAGEAVWRASGLDVTLLRPSVIFGAEDKFLNLFAGLQRLAPVLPLAGSGAQFQPAWVEDVASAIVQCLDRPQTIGQALELVGPTVYTLSQLVRNAGRWSGNPRPQIALPIALGRLQALVLECLPGEPLMSRDNLDSMRVPNVAGGRLPGFAELGIVPTALEAVAPGYLGGQFARARLNRFRASARRG